MEKKLNVGEHSLMGYLPALVVKNILDGKLNKTSELPIHYSMKSVCFMADISGFTKLSETYSVIGRMGAEVLAFMLNRYMEQIITMIGKNGGDIFKFAGDALLVIWPETQESSGQNNMTETEYLNLQCRRAIQCALEIQNKLKNNIAKLSVKIGIGIGEFKIVFVGGQFDRCEYLIIGEGMKQACESETKAEGGGEVICSQDVYNLVQNFYGFTLCKEGDSHGHGPSQNNEKFYKITSDLNKRVPTKADAFIMRTKFKIEKLRENTPILKRFVPAAITLHLDIEQEFWSKELRMITVMFLNLGVNLSDTETEKGMKRVQDIVKTVQRCTYRTRGSLNKFLMDDKGSVMLICWGLPPLSATDDHLRAVITGFDLIRELNNFNCNAYIGISTGSAFSGVCGTIGNRKEYSLLGEIVNLSARNMQKAIEISKNKTPKEPYYILMCKRTAELVSNKLPSYWRVTTKLKGFKNWIDLYTPKNIFNTTPDWNPNQYFSEIKTHLFNMIPQNPPNEKCTVLFTKEEKEEFSDQIEYNYKRVANYPPNYDAMKEDALFILGRNALEDCFDDIMNSLKNSTSNFILIKGMYGSGKSLFIRCLMNKIINLNMDFKKATKYRFIFNSFQTPNSLYDPLNGFKMIMIEIYNTLKRELPPQKFQKSINIASETVPLFVDKIGDILFESEALSYSKYIEEILGVSLVGHYSLPNNANFEKFFSIRNLEPRDDFFGARKFNKAEKTICSFFLNLIKVYLKFLQTERLPLFLIIEDCHQIDEISIIFLKILKAESIPNLIILTSYQECVNALMLSQFDIFGKTNELYNTEKNYLMESISDKETLRDLIRFFLFKNQNFREQYMKNNRAFEIVKTNKDLDKMKDLVKIEDDILGFILSKSFSGNPLFVFDLVNSLVDKNFAVFTEGYLRCSDLLLEMKNFCDWSKFEIPYRIEKLIGNIIDNLNPKEIIVLKCASVIGTIFDINTLYIINPFITIMNDDLLEMIYNFEQMGIIEILYDLDESNLVAKFSLPFLREVLYLRMLSEQKTSIHSEVARNLKTPKFSYSDWEKERQILLRHLIESENTVMNCMETFNKQKDIFREEGLVKELNMNNLKIYIVKKICDKIKIIDMKIYEEAGNKSQMNDIISEILVKKSDSNITWEERFVALTKNRFSYWYKREDPLNNKMPLGYFELKEINTIDILPDYQIGGKQNIIKIYVNSYFKKEIKKGERVFLFSTYDKSKLYEWVISLNFLRVKAIYDEFKTSFGVINLPMAHEAKSSNKKRIKLKLNLSDNDKKRKQNFTYSSFIRKSMKNSSVFTNSLNMSNNNLKKRNSNAANFAQVNTFEEIDETRKLQKIKDLLSFIWTVGNLTFTSFIQQRIFENDISRWNINENKMLPTANHIVQTIDKHCKEIIEITKEDKEIEFKRDNSFNSYSYQNNSSPHNGNIQLQLNPLTKQNTYGTGKEKNNNNNIIRQEINVIKEDQENEETYTQNDTNFNKEDYKKETLNNFSVNNSNFNKVSYHYNIGEKKNNDLRDKEKQDLDSMYTNNLLYGTNNINDYMTEHHDNISIQSKTVGENKLLLKNTPGEIVNKTGNYMNININPKKVLFNQEGKYGNTNLATYENPSKFNKKNLTNPNSYYEDETFQRLKNLDMNNDDFDLDEMLNFASDMKLTTNKK